MSTPLIQRIRKASAKHLLCVLVLFVLTLIAFRVELTQPSLIRTHHDVHGLHYYVWSVIRDAFAHNQFPHWSPYIMGGFPLYAYPQSMVLYWNSLLLLLFPNVQLEILLTLFQVISVFLAGLIMYIVLTKLKFNRLSALTGSIIWAFHGYSRHLSATWIARHSATIWLPAIFYCLWQALTTKHWLKYSTYLALFAAIQFHTGGINFFLFTLLLYGTTVLAHLLTKHWKKRLIKTAAIALVSGTLLTLLILIKVLPLLEFAGMSSQQGFSYEQAVGSSFQFRSPLDWITIFTVQTIPGVNDGSSTNISIAGLFLVIIALVTATKKRLYWVALPLFLIAFLIASGTSLYWPLWKFVPGFDRVHHVNRFTFLIAFSTTLLATLGMARLQHLLKRYKQPIRTSVYTLIFAILFLQLVLPQPNLRPPSDFQQMLKENELLTYLSEQEGVFRVHNFNTNIIAGHASSYTIPNNLQILYGVTSVWLPEYFNIYLGLSHRYPAKFYGMLNTNYLYANEPLNVTGLRFVNKFSECTLCVEDDVTDKGVSGPYLYENEQTLPRAYFTENAILLTGNDQSAITFSIGGLPSHLQLMYQLLIDDQFNPADMVVITDTVQAIQDHPELSRYTALILTPDSINAESEPALSSYKTQGGILLPDVLAGEQQLTEASIYQVLNLSNNIPKALTYTKYTPNEQTIQLTGKAGWVVLAEKYHLFEGWHATIDGKEVPMYKANGIQTALYAPPGSKELNLFYQSTRFTIGLLLLFIGIVLSGTLLYFSAHNSRST